MSATWPVACHSSSSFSCGVDIRLGNVRRRFLSESASFTVGPVGAVGAGGIGGAAVRHDDRGDLLAVGGELEASRRASRASASSSAAATSGRHVRHPDVRRVVGVDEERDALPSGDQVAFDTRAPAGIWIGRFVPSAAEMIWMPMLLRMVSARARLALKSTNTPPSSWNGFENVFIDDRAVADLVEEPLLVGAGVRQRRRSGGAAPARHRPARGGGVA